LRESSSRDRFLVEEMLHHAGVISAIVSEGKSRFLDPTNDRSRYAVQHAIELFAEAAEKVSRPFKSANPRIPWDALRPLRKGVAHPYDFGALRVNAEEVWRFGALDLPRIVRQLRGPRPGET
jgi:uncharacterized protein with HEPN domain